MSESLLLYIDQIDQQVRNAELDTMLSMTEAYMKASNIMESTSPETDLSSFGIFQEAPSIGWKSESPLKRILLFIPRLISNIIKFIFALIFVIIVVIGALVIIAAWKIATSVNKKYKQEVTLDFDPYFIDDFLKEIESLFEYIIGQWNYYKDQYDTSDADAFAQTIVNLSERSSYKERIEDMRKMINDFPTKAYKEQTITRKDFVEVATNFKYRMTKLKPFMKQMQKFMKNASGDSEHAGHQAVREFNKLVVDIGKTMSDFKKKLDVINKEAKSKASAVTKSNPTAEKNVDEIYRQAALCGVGSLSSDGNDLSQAAEINESQMEKGFAQLVEEVKTAWDAGAKERE